MLGKILKYEFKATARVFFPLYGCLLLLAVLNIIMLKLNGLFQTDAGSILNIIALFVTVLLFLYLIAVFLVTVILCIMRFYKNLLRNEGYLMNTLPVSGWTHIGGKLIASVVWSLISIVVIGLAGVLLFFGLSGLSLSGFFQEVVRLFQTIGTEINAEGYLVLLEVGVLCLAGLIDFYLAVFAALTIGHSFYRHKMLFSVIAYFVFSAVENLINSGIIWVANHFSLMQITNDMTQVPHGYLWMLIGEMLVFAVIYGCIGRYFLKNRLNLQ